MRHAYLTKLDRVNEGLKHRDAYTLKMSSPMFDVYQEWTVLGADPQLRGAFDLIAERLGLRQSSVLTKHYLAQFRIYDAEMMLDSVYFSALSSGYFRVKLFPMPLRQIGIKIPQEALDEAPMREIYVAPVSAADAKGTLQDADKATFDENLIGFGVAAGEQPRVIEVYAWEDHRADVNASVELRSNLLTGETTRYYRHRLDTSEPLQPQGDLTSDENEFMRTIVTDLKEKFDPNRLDPVFIYAKKRDHAGQWHLGFYLTSRSYGSSEAMPAAGREA